VELDELVARLSRRDSVEGVVLVGSTGTKELRPNSDYDVLIILDEPAVPLLVGLTTIGGRLTDLLFATTSEVEDLLSGARPPAEAWEGRLARWVREGTIVFDRNGRLQALKRKPSDQSPLSPHDALSHGTWFSLNYNLAQNRRIAASADPVDRTALELRLLYSVFELVQGYFSFRRMDWSGEKVAVRYLAEHDPDYLAAVRACLDEVDLDRRMALYEALAERTLRPFGGLWNPGESIFQFRPGTRVSGELVRETEAFWNSLVSS
jgi:predicted nucleotidyltransferase